MSDQALILYTDSSPNGYKITIALEELGLPYELRHVRLDRDENLLPEFLQLNPHGRIPVLVDCGQGITLFESAAILLYLADKSGRLLPVEKAGRWQAITWLLFHASSVSPILGQRVHFEIFAREPYAPAIERYRNLSASLFSTMDRHLASQPWLAGDEYSIADIASFGWMHIARIIDFDFAGFQHLSEWFERVAQRPAVQRAVLLPEPATGP